MATFSRIKTWVSNEVLASSDLNNEFNNILNNMTPSGIEDASADVAAMQANVTPGSVGTESLATDFLGEIQRLRFVIKRLVGAQWYTDPGRSLAAGGLGIQTADIADGAVTYPKLAPLNKQVSSVEVLFEVNAPTYTDITNLTVTITTTGRPVMLMLQPADAVVYDFGLIYHTLVGSQTDYYAEIGITRNGDPLTRLGTALDSQFISGFKPINNFSTPPSAFSTVDLVAAGTYTYQIQAYTSSSDAIIGFQHIQLVAYEL